MLVLEKDVENPTEHATEGGFCEGECSSRGFSETSANADAIKMMEKIAEIAAVMEVETEDTVKEAKKTADRRKLNKRIARLKVQKCLGRWHEEEGSFEEFSIEEQVDCKFEKLHSIRDPLKREKYYQEVLREDFWKMVTSEEDNNFLREELLKTSVDPFYSPSTRSSIQLLSMYLGWRDNYDNYDLMETIAEKERFLRQIGEEATVFSSQLDPRYAKRDISLLNEGISVNFSEALAEIRSVPMPAVSDTGGASRQGSSINYKDIKQQSVKGLYR